MWYITKLRMLSGGILNNQEALKEMYNKITYLEHYFQILHYTNQNGSDQNLKQ